MRHLCKARRASANRHISTSRLIGRWSQALTTSYKPHKLCPRKDCTRDIAQLQALPRRSPWRWLRVRGRPAPESAPDQTAKQHTYLSTQSSDAAAERSKPKSHVLLPHLCELLDQVLHAQAQTGQFLASAWQRAQQQPGSSAHAGRDAHIVLQKNRPCARTHAAEVSHTARSAAASDRGHLVKTRAYENRQHGARTSRPHGGRAVVVPDRHAAVGGPVVAVMVRARDVLRVKQLAQYQGSAAAPSEANNPRRAADTHNRRPARVREPYKGPFCAPSLRRPASLRCTRANKQLAEYRTQL